MHEQQKGRSAPSVGFGRCCVTGEWGKVVNIDLGDIAISVPDTTKGVERNPETGELTFTCWRTESFKPLASLSPEGLKELLALADSQPNPIPGLSPDLVYGWRVLYKDGSGLSQFTVDPATGQEVEHSYSEIDWDQVTSLIVKPRHREALPSYLVAPAGFFLRNGEILNVGYDRESPERSKLFYARKVTHTWGASTPDTEANRQIDNVFTSVLQLVGWEHANGQKCVIAIDERGNWRPYEYE